MRIKAEVEIEIRDEDIGTWLESHGVCSERSDIIGEIEEMEFPETIAGLNMMIHFFNASEMRAS